MQLKTRLEDLIALLRGLPLFIWVMVSGGAALGVMLFSVFIGFELNERELPGHDFFRKVDRKLGQIFKIDAAGGPKLRAQTYSSTLLRLTSEVGIVPTGRSNRLGALSAVGGGLTSFGEDVLVLPYNGRIYAARSADEVRPTDIFAPDNNRAAYQALPDDPAYERYSFDLHYLRYNDLLHIEMDEARALVASYTEYHPERKCYTNTLAKLDIPSGVQSIDEVSAGAEDWTILYRTRPCLPLKARYGALEGHMAGGRLAFRAPSQIVMTSGDFHFDGMRSSGRGIAQDPNAEYGKVLGIDLNTGESQILSTGHRNPQGLTIDSEGNILVVEHGPSGGDELNQVKEGANYGWPRESFGISYSGLQMPEAATFGRHEVFEAPALSWVPSIAVSGLTEVRGFHESWDGDLLASSLIKGGAIHRIRRQNGRVLYSEPILIGSRVRYVHQHTNGQIILWTDNEELVFLSPQEKGSEAAYFKTYLSWRDYSPGVEAKLESLIGRCSECHSFAVDDHGQAPSLARIYDAPIGSADYANYTDAMRRKGGRWTEDNLAAFLADPQAFVPGTSMPPVGDGDKAATRALIDYLKQIETRF